MVKQREYNAQLNILEGKISCPIGSTTTASIPSIFVPPPTPLVTSSPTNTQSSGLASTTNAPAITTPPSTLNASVTQNLKVGASGQNVISLQHFLESKGFLTIPTGVTEGYFGNLTKQALTTFQKANGLPATGYCGPMTRSVIENSQ